jgi:prepilin-type N-terminal cleavage/methylation domain-containing protein
MRRPAVNDAIGQAPPALAGDAGVTLIETLAAVAIIGMVMTSMAVVFVQSMAVTHQQGVRQAAAQLAADGLNRVRSWPGPLVADAVASLNGDPDLSSPDRSGVSFRRAWTLAGAGSPRKLTVTVSWTAARCPCSFAVATLVSVNQVDPVFDTTTP